MSDSFVPFAKQRSKPGAATDKFRLTVLPQAPTLAPLPAAPAATNLTAHAGSGGKEPQVTVERDGDRITRIRVQCVCGEVVELNCVS